jgi:hypothetical protein
MRSAVRGIILGGSWTPRRLGASLLAWWDAERSDLITQSGALVSSWKDIVAAYNAVQAVGSQKPAYSGTSFNGRPGITFDGVDDVVEVASLSALPSGATPGEIWALTDQTALVADTGARVIAGYPNNNSTEVRRIERNVVSAANRAVIRVGTGSGTFTPTNASVDFSGRHVVRGIIGATASQVDVDGTANGSQAGVPSTTLSTFRIGASPTADVSYWQGVHNTIICTTALSAAQAAQMYAFLNRRL